MVKRQCLKCYSWFDKKSTYDYHINRKTDCDTNNNHLNDTNDENFNDAVLCDFVQNSCRKMRNEFFLPNSNHSNISKLDLVETNDYIIDTDDYSLNINNTSFCCKSWDDCV